MFIGTIDVDCVDALGLYNGNHMMDLCENWNALADELTVYENSVVLADLFDPLNFPDAYLSLAGNKCRWVASMK